MSNIKVSSIIVTRGLGDYLKRCLDSIRRQRYGNFEIIVIDNSINPIFSQQVACDYPEIKPYTCRDNLFYCQALNKGIKESRGEFVLCLNDDVVLDEMFMEEALKGFDTDKSVGMVSGKILRKDGRVIDSTGLYLSIWMSAGERGYGRKDRGQFEQAGYIFGVNGAVAFYRKAMLDEIKIDTEYFDHDFHIFYEDLDVAWRAQRLGWKGYYMPKAVAYHLRGGTVREVQGINKGFARRYLGNELHFDLVKNRYLTIIKNIAFWELALRLPFIMIYDFFVWLHIFLSGPALVKTIFLSPIPITSAFRKRKLFSNKRLTGRR